VAKQDDKNATYANNITPEIEKINWNTNGENIINLIHGLFDEPIAYSVYENQRIKIYDAFFLNEKTLNNPGTITNISKEGIKVSCNNGTIVITKLQIPGKKPISVKELINGKHFFKIEEYFF
jgi:methionyl-tRNA formyltransferase